MPFTLETGCACKAKELRFLEMPDNVFVHIPELTAVALINNKDHLFIFYTYIYS